MKPQHTLDEIAQIAYKAYGDSTKWLNYQGLPMPTWSELPPKIQDAWKAAAKAAIDAFPFSQVQIGGTGNKQSIR